MDAGKSCGWLAWGSERVSYGEVERERVAERFHVVVSSSSGVVGEVYSYAEVAAHDEHSYVESESGSCAGGEILEECGAAEFSSRTHGIVAEQPDVARVEEYCSVERSVDGEAVFDVELEFECSGLVKISVDEIFGHLIAARADASDGECADGVGSSDIELFGVGDCFGVAIGVCGADRHAADEPVVAVEASVVDELCLAFEKGVPNSFFSPFFPAAL